MSHITRMKGSYHTYECLLSHIWMSHIILWYRLEKEVLELEMNHQQRATDRDNLILDVCEFYTNWFPIFVSFRQFNSRCIFPPFQQIIWYLYVYICSIYTYAYVCIYVCMYVYICISMFVSFPCKWSDCYMYICVLYICMYVYVCMCVCVCVCKHIFMYMYRYMYTYI